jgi:hypothetical protein
MDDFISVLKKGLTGAGKGPVLIAAGLMSGIVYAIGLFNTYDVTSSDIQILFMGLLLTFIPLIAIPFITGGALGFALETSAGGKPGWSTFFASARRHYFSLFFASIAILAVATLLSYPGALLIISGAGDVSLLCMAELFTFIALFVVLMFLEFYDVTIVSERVGALDGLRASIAFVQNNLRRVLPFFLIVLVAKLLVQLPLFAAETLRLAADIGANYSLYFNNTTNGTLNASYFNSTLTAQAEPLGAPTLMVIAVLQILVQTVVFAFVISYKVEFFQWAKSYKTAKKITDFDYDFSDERKE